MATAATMMVTARERLSAEIAGLEERLRVKGGLWEDQQARLNALRDVRDWMDEEQRQRDEIEAEAALEAATRPDPNEDTKKLFAPYRKHLRETGRAR